MEEQEEAIEPKPLPVWITVPIGLLLLPICLISIIGSIYIIFIPDAINPIFNLIGGTLFAALSIWVTAQAVRLAFNLKRKGPGLFSPITLKLIAICVVLIPIISLVVGSFWEKPIIYSAMAIAYFLAAIGLFKLSAAREN